MAEHHGGVDLVGGAISRATFEMLATDPGSPAEGRFWYNTTAHIFRYQNNGTTVDLGVATAYTDENAKDAVGGILVDSSTIDFTYDDAANSGAGTITAVVLDSPTLQGSNKAFFQNTDNHVDGTTNHVFTAADDTKLTGIATGATANSSDATLLARANHTGTQSADTLTDGTTNKAFLATERTKLSGIATGATANSSDATLLSRSNHTGTQASSTISDLATVVQGYRLNQFASPNGDLSIGSQELTNVAAAVGATDAPNLGQVQDLINTGTNKTSVRGASTGNLTVASALVNGLVHDGVTYATGDRILLKDQSTGSQNGIYIIASSGAASRATDADIAAEVKGGLSVWVNEGTTNGDSRWVLTTNDPITLGTTSLVFTKDFQATDLVAGNGLTKTGTTLNVVANADNTITANADDIQVNKANVALRKTSTFGNGSLTSFTIAHGMGTKYLVGVTIYKESTGEIIYANVVVDATNIVISGFATAPASNSLTVVWG